MPTSSDLLKYLPSSEGKELIYLTNLTASFSEEQMASFASAYNARRRKPMVMLLLNLFLGCLGAARFYLGRMGMGILYLFTGGILGIGCFIDIFRFKSLTTMRNIEIANEIAASINVSMGTAQRGNTVPAAAEIAATAEDNSIPQTQAAPEKAPYSFGAKKSSIDDIMDMKSKTYLLIPIIVVLLAAGGAYYVFSTSKDTAQKNQETATLSQEKNSDDEAEEIRETDEESDRMTPTQAYKDLSKYRIAHIPLVIHDQTSEITLDMEMELVNFIGMNNEEWKNVQINFKSAIDNALRKMSRELDKNNYYTYLKDPDKFLIRVASAKRINGICFQTFIENIGFTTIRELYKLLGYKEVEIQQNPLDLRIYICVATSNADKIIKDSIDLETIKYYATINWNTCASDSGYATGHIKGTNVNMREVPSTGSKVVYLFHGGETVEVHGKTEAKQNKYPWYKVTYNGYEGWVYGQFIETD
ncbi:MAG: NINE protein [Synergistes jonesii]|uniref:NINE protein n=1 Tax=Synergistes jonesii TaxID=2754 RepID=UPI002A74972C|nr:NINE protein [Synergistes jonesii]MDY2985662.1 NINE protein [Synergistes jonesii]